MEVLYSGMYERTLLSCELKETGNTAFRNCFAGRLCCVRKPEFRVGKPESHVIGIAFHGNAKKGSHKGVRQVRWHRG